MRLPSLGFARSAQLKSEELMKNIYVGNLSFDATEDQVRSMFEAYGPVDTGQHRYRS